MNRKFLISRYPAYKDSGIEWIGEIPKYWEVKRINDIAVQQKIKNAGLIEKNLLSLSYGKIKRKDFKSNFGLLPESFETYQITENGNIILRLTDLQNDKKSLRVGLVKERGLITSAYLCLHLFKYIDPVFAYYLFFTYDICKVFYWFGGGLRQSMKFDDIKVLPFIIPPLNEQKAIANYLDTKTAQIDRQIDLLTEKAKLYNNLKQSLINETVTRGLDKTVLMKDSGIEWIGEIPEHWRIYHLKNCVSLKITDGPHETPNFTDNGVPFISAEAIQNGGVNFDSKRGYISEETDKIYALKCKPRRDDIFIVKSGSTTGKIGYVSTDINFNIWSPLALVRANKINYSRYLFYFLSSSFFQKQVQMYWSLGTQPNIGMKVLENLQVIVPPLTEQKEIADYLNTKTSQIDKIIETINTQIEKLKELRKTLINDVVTGKIKVV
jgi:type I restriction enzyme S subunit